MFRVSVVRILHLYVRLGNKSYTIQPSYWSNNAQVCNQCADLAHSSFLWIQENKCSCTPHLMFLSMRRVHRAFPGSQPWDLSEREWCRVTMIFYLTWLCMNTLRLGHITIGDLDSEKSVSHSLYCSHITLSRIKCTCNPVVNSYNKNLGKVCFESASGSSVNHNTDVGETSTFLPYKGFISHLRIYGISS